MATACASLRKVFGSVSAIVLDSRQVDLKRVFLRQHRSGGRSGEQECEQMGSHGVRRIRWRQGGGEIRNR